jgi:hypothetical protein
MTPDPHIAVIGPLALACLRGECPPEVMKDVVAETGWLPTAGVVREAIRIARREGQPLAGPRHMLEAVVAIWRREQATEALRAAPPDGAGTCYHETPR